MSFMVPDSEWVVPKELPDLVGMGVRVAAQDLETRDDGIAGNRGAGWATGAGHVCGVAVAWGGGSAYIPISHPDTACFDKEVVARWLRDMDRGGVQWVFHNGTYDMGWRVKDLGVEVPPVFDDTHAASVMLDENRLSYRLDAICGWLGIPGKDKVLLKEAGEALGVGGGGLMSNLWRIPGRFVGPYAEADAVATLAAWEKLRPMMEEEGVDEAYRLERDLMPLCMQMRMNGIRIDTEKAENARVELREARDLALKEVGEIYREGRDVTINDVLSPLWLERAFDAEGIVYPRTAKSGRGSFQSDWLEKHPAKLARAIQTARYFQMIEDKFIRGFLLDYCHRGRLHAEINQLRDDEGGTRSHRFSYSDPPLQQMPSPKRGSGVSKAAGKLIRSCFVPEEGCLWGSSDYSQQEFRLMVHFASLRNLPKADWAVQKYVEDPDTDFHNLAVELTGLPRPEAKDVNFAKAFGAGVHRFSEMTGRSPEESRRIMDQYDEELPFIKMLSDQCRKAADSRGYVRLIDGARCRFDTWEPGWGYEGGYYPPVTLGEARARVAAGSGHAWEGAKLRRAFTHKAMNRLIQGSAARQTKLAMRELGRLGVVPLLQMHDEININMENKDELKVLVDVMENVYPLELPVKADGGYGKSWGELTGD